MYKNPLALLRIMRSPVACAAVSVFLNACLDLSSIRDAGDPQRSEPLAYYDWARSADSNELIAEKKRLETVIVVTDQVIPVVQLSLLLTLVSDSGTHDIDRAITLLEEIELSCDSTDCQSYFLFGGLWRGLLLERREFGAAIASGTKSDQELEILREQVKKLSQQIEALTNIEQQLIEREQLQKR